MRQEMEKNINKQDIHIHISKEELNELDEYIKKNQITTRKKFIEFLVYKFIKTIK